MSFDAAVGRIAQIVTLQQQLADPVASGGLPTVAAAAAALAGSSANFASALASAQSGASGSTAAGAGSGAAATTTGAGQAGTTAGTTGLGTTATAPASLGALPAAAIGLPSATGGAAVDPRVVAMLQEANSLVGKPYVYGGGHSGWGPQAGYDCSGFVSAVLHAGGYLTSPVDTTSLPSQPGMVSGPGQYVTVYDRAQPGQSGHVIIEIAGQFYESGGAAGPWGGGGGVQRIATPSAAYLATFTTVLHPQGL